VPPVRAESYADRGDPVRVDPQGEGRAFILGDPAERQTQASVVSEGHKPATRNAAAAAIRIRCASTMVSPIMKPRR